MFHNASHGARPGGHSLGAPGVFHTAVLLTTALLTCAFLAAGCSGPRPPELAREVPGAFPNHTLRQIQTRIARSTDTLRAFEATARLRIASPQQSGRFNATLRGRRGDSLFVSISPGLGIEAARALVTPDSFFVYDRINGRLTYGALADAAGQLPAPLLSGTVFENLTGIAAPEADVEWSLAADSSRYRLRSPDGRRTYTVDPAFWRVTRYVERAPGGAVVEERRFSAFDDFGGLVLPREVVLRRPQEETTVSAYYRRLTPNPGALSFDLDVPASAEHVRIGGG